MSFSFSQCFRSTFSQGLTKAKEVITTSSSFSSVLGALNRFRSHLNTTSGMVDSFCGALLTDSSLISDKYLNSKVVQLDGELPDIVLVDDDVAESICEGLGQAIHNGTDSISFDGISLSDATGRVYNVVDQRSNNVVIDGKTVLFSMTYDVSSIKEAILYVDEEDHYYFNNNIRTANYVKSSAARSVPEDSTVDEIIHDIYFIRYNQSAEEKSSTEIMSIMYDDYNPTASFRTNLFNWADAKGTGPSEDDSDEELALGLWYEYDNDYPLAQGSGSVQSIWTLVSDNLESASINDALSDTCDAILSSSSPEVSLDALSERLSKSRYSSVRDIGRSAKRAYGEGKLAGVAGYVLQFAKSMTSLVDNNGVFEPTDNTRFLPRGYIAGIVKTIISAVVTMIGVIVSMFTRILGIVIMLLGQALSAIFSAVDNNSRCTIERDNIAGTDPVDSSDPGGHVVFPVAPYSLAGYGPAMSTMVYASDDLVSLFEQEQYFGALEIPGGYVLYGPQSYGANGKPDQFRIEFHPSITQSDPLMIRTLIGYLYDYNLVRITTDIPYTTGPIAHSAILCHLDWNSTYKNLLRNDILGLWDRYITDSALSNAEDGYTDVATDAAVKAAIVVNSFVGLMYLSTFIPDGSPDYFNLPTSSWRSIGGHYIEPHNWDAAVTGDSISGYWSLIMGLSPYSSTSGQTLRPELLLEFSDHEYGRVNCGVYNFSSFFSNFDWTQVYYYFARGGEGGRLDSTVRRAFWVEVFRTRSYYNEIQLMPKSWKYAVRVPNIDKKQFWFELIATLVVAGIVTGAVAKCTLKVKKLILKKRAFNEMAVSNAWETFTKHPTEQNYQAYRQAVRRNNIWSTFIGGTKFGYSSYWNGAPESSAPDSGSTTNVIGNAFSSAAESTQVDNATASETEMSSQNRVTSEQDVTLKKISELITGSFSFPNPNVE